MEQFILRLLADWESSTGWDLWADPEGVAAEYGWVTDPKGMNYPKFKRALDQLSTKGLIEQSVPNRRIARATWCLTELGHSSLLDGVGEEKDSEGDNAVGKRITYPVDKELWKGLIERFKSGELDVAFMPSKKNRR